ncbi:MAG: adenylosuccinate synthase [Bacteroidota bacterium]
MKNIDVLIGLQWGDEGKGKIVDVLTPQYEIIARFQGGPNAGHTLEFDGMKHVLHTIPSGIFHAGKMNVIGNGVVIDPVILHKEILKLAERKVDVSKNLMISRKAHLILPSHRLLDAANEAAKGKEKIGSTLKGIGPAYTDKTARNGIRTGDIEKNDFIQIYESLKGKHLELIKNLGFDFSQYAIDGLLYSEYEKKWFEAIEVLKSVPFTDSEIFINKSLAENKNVLAEGAQGSLLDIDFGTYPFVTSSNTVCAGVCTGLGVSPRTIGEVYGIFKAYCTRVGSGPFPTELFDETGEAMRKNGNEYGSTTGRPRRCGWLDIPALKYSVMLNGTSRLIMMKGDVLSSFQKINVCTTYRYKNSEIDYIPYDINTSKIVPVYKEFDGWYQPVSNISSFEKLPGELKKYIGFIENAVNTSVSIVSVGPDRTQTIIR